MPQLFSHPHARTLACYLNTGEESDTPASPSSCLRCQPAWSPKDFAILFAPCVHGRGRFTGQAAGDAGRRCIEGRLLTGPYRCTGRGRGSVCSVCKGGCQAGLGPYQKGSTGRRGKSKDSRGTRAGRGGRGKSVDSRGGGGSQGRPSGGVMDWMHAIQQGLKTASSCLHMCHACTQSAYACACLVPSIHARDAGVCMPIPHRSWASLSSLSANGD